MDHYIPLLFVYLLKNGIILFWQNVRFSWKICNNIWSHKACNFDTAQCGDYISAHHHINSSKYLLSSVYDRLHNTFWPSYVGVILAINYDINLDTEDHIPYKPCSVVLMDSKEYVNTMFQAYHILNPLFQHVSFVSITWTDMEKEFQQFSGKSASEIWGFRN